MLRTLRRTGFALASTFMVAFIVLLAGFTMAEVASFNYRLSKQTQLRDEAFDAANAGLSLAMAQLIHDADWGSARKGRAGDVLPDTHITGVPFTPSDAQHFYVTFDPGGAPSGYPSGLPWSVNNLQGSHSMNGPLDPANQVPHQVPAGSALIFVAGVAGDASQTQMRIIEALLQAPTYNYALTASQGIVSYCCGGWWTNSCMANLVDGETHCEVGNVLVRPLPGGACWKGGYQGGVAPGCGVTPPYAVFMPNGSVVTGRVVTAGKTNFRKVCDPNPCNANCHVCTPPQARNIVQVCASASPSPGESIPDLRPVLAPTIAIYTCPSTYPSSSPSTLCFVTVPICNPTACGPTVPVKVYSNGPFVFPTASNSPIQVNGDTLLVAPSPTGNQEPILLMGRWNKPLEFTGEYTLTIQNAFINIPGGIVGSASNYVNATLILLPLPINGCKAPNLNESNQIRVRHNYHSRCHGQCGLGSACTSNVSVFSIGNLVVGDPSRGTCCCACKWCSCKLPWEMDGLFASVGGSLTFWYNHVRVRGMLLAEDPWKTVQCCGGKVKGNMGIIYMYGDHVSYSPTMARQASVGQAIAPAATQRGLEVVYWRDIQPGL